MGKVPQNEKFVFRAVGMDDVRLGEPAAELLTAFHVLLDDLDLHTELQKLPCEVVADAAAADDDRRAQAVLDIAHLLVEFRQLAVCCRDIDAVAALQGEGAVGDGQGFAPLDGAHKHMQAQPGMQQRPPRHPRNSPSTLSPPSSSSLLTGVRWLIRIRFTSGPWTVV